MAELSEFERDFQALSAEMRKLEGEYTMYFSGRLPRPPWETRGRVEQLFKRWDRKPLDNLMSRFRFQTLQSRYTKFVDLWDRAMRAREEGRVSPLGRRQDLYERATAPAALTDTAEALEAEAGEPASVAARAVTRHSATFSNPREEIEKLTDLYGSVMDARRQAGEDIVPFHKFAALVKEQVQRLKSRGAPEVTFRVTTVDGRVNLTAKVASAGELA